MSDDTNQPPQQPLEYYHSNAPGPLHPVLLIFCLLGGGAIGAAVVLFGGVVVVLPFSGGEGPHNNGWPVKFTAAGCIALFVLCIYGVIRITRRSRTLSIEHRRTAGRYFLLGLLIGCGLAFLAEGICFTASVIS